MAVSLNDIFLFTLNASCFGQRIMLTQTYRVLTLGVAATEKEVADDFLAAVKSGGTFDIETKWAECVITDATVTSLWMQKIAPTRWRREETPGTEAGTLPSAELSNISAALTMTTAVSGRNQQAVKKIGPATNNNLYVSNGLLTSTYKLALLELGTQLATDVDILADAVTLRPVIYHGPTAPVAWNDVVGWHVEDSARSMSRRVVGRGI